jgi:hypothetical protein
MLSNGSRACGRRVPLLEIDPGSSGDPMARREATASPLPPGAEARGIGS